MNILAFSNYTGSVQWRLRGVANYLNAKTEHSMYVASSKEWGNDTLGADIVVAQMWRNPKGIDVCHQQGAKVVYEADDIIIGVGGKDRLKLMNLDEGSEEMTKETIRKSDLVTVTTEKIAEHYRQFNDNVVVLPNYMDFMWWGKPWKQQSVNHIRLGWAGSVSHHEDLIMIKPTIEKILKNFPQVKFIYCGHGGRKGIIGDEVFDDLPHNRREYYVGVPTEYWPMKSKSMGFDIGIAPLLDDEFNSGKSAIKYYEYAANLVPGVYSNTVVYNGTIKPGKTGFLAKSEDEWYRYLSRLITEKDLRERIMNAAYQDVLENYNLDDHYHKWIEAYERTSSGTS